jgi:hypothetical protein
MAVVAVVAGVVSIVGLQLANGTTTPGGRSAEAAAEVPQPVTTTPHISTLAPSSPAVTPTHQRTAASTGNVRKKARASAPKATPTATATKAAPSATPSSPPPPVRPTAKPTAKPTTPQHTPPSTEPTTPDTTPTPDDTPTGTPVTEAPGDEEPDA